MFNLIEEKTQIMAKNQNFKGPSGQINSGTIV